MKAAQGGIVKNKQRGIAKHKYTSMQVLEDRARGSINWGVVDTPARTPPG